MSTRKLPLKDETANPCPGEQLRIPEDSRMLSQIPSIDADSFAHIQAGGFRRALGGEGQKGWTTAMADVN